MASVFIFRRVKCGDIITSPNMIEDITILKDAAAVAPYGMAGANGVVLVTTKKGKSGAPVLSYNGYIGFQNPTRITDQVNSYE